MKLFKKFDFYIQILLLTGGIVFASTLSVTSIEFLYPYYVLGGWQLFSFTIHLLIKKNWIPYWGRLVYGKIILGLIITGISAFLLAYNGMTTLLIFYWIGLVFVSPFFAAWYIWVCWMELSVVRKRELVHLK